MDDRYGLPGQSALDSPYGLSPVPSTMPRSAPIYYTPALRMPGLPAPAFDTPPPRPGAGVLRWTPPAGNNVSPMRPGTFPTVGRDISIQDFVNLQRQGESGSDYQALNRQKPGNTASGAYQVTDATWNNYGGYKKALLAPKEVQDQWYAEQLDKRLKKYQGDPFKILAEHYLPRLASDPARWGERFRFKNGHTVEPVAKYLRQMVRGSALEEPLEQYLRSYGIQ